MDTIFTIIGNIIGAIIIFIFVFLFPYLHTKMYYPDFTLCCCCDTGEPVDSDTFLKSRRRNIK